MKVNKPWLITGANGYLASNLLSLNLEILDNAILIDLSLPKARANQQAYSLDFADLTVNHDSISGTEIAGIIHLAALKSVGDSFLNPDLYNLENYEKSVKLFLFSREKGIKKFIFASSAAVYSQPLGDERPVDEIFETRPLSPYGRNKIEFEEFLKSNSSIDTEIYVLRFFNLAGGISWLGRSGAINQLLTSVYMKSTFFVNGGLESSNSSLNTVRDYVDARDAALAVASCLKNTKPHPYETYNVCTGTGVTLREVIDIVWRATGIEVSLQKAQNFNQEVSWMVGDRNKIEESLGWKPNFGMSSIVSDAWNRSNPDAL